MYSYSKSFLILWLYWWKCLQKHQGGEIETSSIQLSFIFFLCVFFSSFCFVCMCKFIHLVSSRSNLSTYPCTTWLWELQHRGTHTLSLHWEEKRIAHKFIPHTNAAHGQSWKCFLYFVFRVGFPHFLVPFFLFSYAFCRFFPFYYLWWLLFWILIISHTSA